MLNVCEGILEGSDRGSLATASDEKEHGKYVIVDVAGLHENKDAGC